MTLRFTVAVYTSCVMVVKCIDLEFHVLGVKKLHHGECWDFHSLPQGLHTQSGNVKLVLFPIT
jgi:hypothetical protein